MKTTENALNWFEIAVSDIARAQKFYEVVFGIVMVRHDMMGMQMAFFMDTEGNKIGIHSNK